MALLLTLIFTVDNAELLPLMEGEGKAFRVLGFNQSQRAQFVQILTRSSLFVATINDFFKDVMIWSIWFFCSSIDCVKYISDLVLETLIGLNLLPA